MSVVGDLRGEARELNVHRCQQASHGSRMGVARVSHGCRVGVAWDLPPINCPLVAWFLSQVALPSGVKRESFGSERTRRTLR